MALWSGLHTVEGATYHRTFTQRYGYETSDGHDNARYIFNWFLTRQSGVKYDPLCGMMGCFNGESRLNPAAVFGFNNCAYLLQNRKRAFGICQFVPGCKPKDHDENYYQNYHGSGKPIYYYWLANHLSDNLNYLYNENDAPCSDMDAQLEYIYNQNGWKRSTSSQYAAITGKSYSGSFSDFLTSSGKSIPEYAEWFYAAFVRSGSPDVALPRYAQFAQGIYQEFYDEFGGGEPHPPIPPVPPVPLPKPSNFLIVAKAAGLF